MKCILVWAIIRLSVNPNTCRACESCENTLEDETPNDAKHAMFRKDEHNSEDEIVFKERKHESMTTLSSADLSALTPRCLEDMKIYIANWFRGELWALKSKSH